MSRTEPADTRRWSLRRQLGVGTVLALSMTAAVIPNASLSVLADFLVRDLGLSHAQIGGLIATFSAAGALWAPVGGWLSDWAGGRTLLLVAFASVIVMVVLLSLARGFPWMLGLLVLGAFPNGASNPATNKLVSHEIPLGERGTVVGVKQSGPQLSYVLTGLALPTIALLFNWRWALASTILIPIIGIVGVRMLLPRASARAEPAGNEAGGASGNRWLVGYAFFMGAAMGSVIAYLPLYSIQQVGFGAQAAGLLVALMNTVGVLARIGLARSVESVGHYARPLGMLSAAAFAGIGMVWLSSVGGLGWLLWIAVLVLGSSLVAWNSVGMLAVMRDAGHERTGRASGHVLAGFLAGLAASPTLFGYSVDVTGSYVLGWSSLLTLVALAALCTLGWLRRSSS